MGSAVKDARLRERGEAAWSQELSQRAGRNRGDDCFSTTGEGEETYYEWTKQQDGRNRNLFVV